jgi:hypothetical protein
VRISRFITIGLAALLALAAAPGLASASPASFEDNDFAGGTPGTNTTVVAPGTLQLKRTVTIDEGFDSALTWTPVPWSAGGTASVDAGVLKVDGALVGPADTFNAPQSLRFTATFSTDPFQNVGLGTDFNDAPWAMFSTGNGGTLPVGLYARTFTAGGTPIDEPVVGVDPLSPHGYEIRWTASAVAFYVDGALKSTQTVALPTGLRVLASDFTLGGAILSVDQLNLGSYPASGTFTSRVFDGGAGLTAWGTLTPDAANPDVTFKTQSGDTPTPDSSWSSPEALGTGGAIQSPPRRYLQYQATLASTGTSTPSLDKVTIAYDVDTTKPAATIANVDVTGATARVSFSSPDADVARLECSLDGAAFGTCTSPATFAGLAVGSHTIAVRATDKAGNVGDAASKAFAIAAPPSQTNSGGSGDSSTPPAGSTTVVTTRDTVAPRLGITPKSVRVSRTGQVTLKVKCPSGETRCKVTMRLKLGSETVAKKTTTIRGGKTVAVSLKLSASARAKLARRGSLKVTAAGTATDAAGNVKVTSTRITLKTASTHR